MTDPRRLLDEGADEFELSLLRAHAADGPSGTLLKKTLVAMGVAGAATAVSGTAAGAAAAPGAAKATAGAAGMAWLSLLKWVGVGTLCGGAVVSVSVVRNAYQEPARVIAPSAVPAEPRVQAPRSLPALREPAEAPAVSAEPPAPTVATAPQVARPVVTGEPASAASGAGTAPAVEVQAGDAGVRAPGLAEEIAALDGVRGAIAARNGAQALRLLDSHEREYPRSKLGLEATVLRIEALVASGNLAAARALAARFLSSPGSAPHARRVRSLVGDVSNL